MNGSIILKRAAAVAVPVEAVFLFVFSTIEWGVPTHPPPQGIIAECGRSAALLIHLPGVAMTSVIQAGFSYYPILFVSGWFETGVVLAAALWLFSWLRERLLARRRGP
jgi:hypothetical protein